MFSLGQSKICHTNVVPVTKSIIQLQNIKISLGLVLHQENPEPQLPRAAREMAFQYLEMAFHCLKMAFLCLEMAFHCLEMALLCLIASTAKPEHFYLEGGKKLN